MIRILCRFRLQQGHFVFISVNNVQIFWLCISVMPTTNPSTHRARRSDISLAISSLKDMIIGPWYMLVSDVNCSQDFPSVHLSN